MIKRLCLFTIGFAHNRQGIINYLEKIIPSSVELHLFVSKECQSKYSTNKAILFESKLDKHLCFFELRDYCKDKGIDRLINMGSLPQEGFEMMLASIFTKTNFMCYLVINPLEFLNYPLNKWSIKSFFQTLLLYPFTIFPEKFFVCSRDLTKICKKYALFSRKKIFQLPGTIDTDLFCPKNKRNLRKKFKIPLKKKVIISVGRIEHAKGADFLFELAKRNKEILFILIGKLDFSYQKEKSLKNVQILEKKSPEELVEFYNLSDLCLVPSRAEGFGLVPREAMSCGTPTIVSDILSLKMIKPAIKVKLDRNSIEEKIHNFFKLSTKEKKKLSIESRKFVLNESSYKSCKSLYLYNLLN